MIHSLGSVNPDSVDRRHGGSIMHCASIFPKAVSHLVLPGTYTQRPSIGQLAYCLIAKILTFIKQYTLHTGGSSITTYNDPATQSGQPLARSFCSICGSKLAARTPLNEDIVSIPAGILLSGNSGLGSIAKHEGADRRGVRWKPQKEQFCQEKAPWLADLGELVADERYVRGPFSEKVVDGGEGAGRL